MFALRRSVRSFLGSRRASFLRRACKRGRYETGSQVAREACEDEKIGNSCASVASPKEYISRTNYNSRYLFARGNSSRGFPRRTACGTRLPRRRTARNDHHVDVTDKSTSGSPRPRTRISYVTMPAFSRESRFAVVKIRESDPGILLRG